MARRDGPELRGLAFAQDDVVSRPQLRAVGIDRQAVAAEVQGRRWQLVGRQVVVLHNGPLTERQRHWIAVLHAGPSAVLFGSSALRASGVALPAAGPVHVAVPRGSHAADLDDPRICIRVHELRRWSVDDVHPVLEPRRHRTARAAVDAATLAATDNAVRSLFCAVVQQRHVAAPALRAAVERTSRVRKRGVMREVLADIEGGSQSLPELLFVRAIRRAGLPIPTRQQRVQRPDGTWYLDAVWSEFGLVVEIDGAQHQDVLAREADAARDRELAIIGVSCVRFSAWVVRRDERVVADTVERLLRARGWAPARERLAA